MLLLALWLHVMSAIIWIGGMLFVALVAVPAMGTLADVPLRARLLRELGLRSRAVSWIAIGFLILTGLINLWAYPFLLESPRFLWKVGLVVWALMLSALHDFVLGPRASGPDADPDARTHASWVARINAVVVLVIVLLSLSLRG